MAKVGISLTIDVTKIEKARLYQGQKGTYLDATVFVDLDEADQYGNNGMITQMLPRLLLHLHMTLTTISRSDGKTPPPLRRRLPSGKDTRAAAQCCCRVSS